MAARFHSKSGRKPCTARLIPLTRISAFWAGGGAWGKSRVGVVGAGGGADDGYASIDKKTKTTAAKGDGLKKFGKAASAVFFQK